MLNLVIILLYPFRKKQQNNISHMKRMSKEYQRELYKPLKPLPHGRLLDSKLLHLHSSMHQLLTSFGGGLNSGRSQQQPLIVFSPYVHFGDGGVKVGGVDDNYHRDNNNNNHDHLILSLIGDLREIIEDQAMDISSTCFVYTGKYIMLNLFLQKVKISKSPIHRSRYTHTFHHHHHQHFTFF